MDTKKNLLLHIGEEAFLFTVSQLSPDQRLDIESLAEGAFDDYGDEIEGMDAYQLCGWFQDKAKEQYGIELTNAPLDYEISIKAGE